MAKFVKVILFLLLTVAFHSIAGNVSTAKVVDEQERAITYAMRQHGEISAPDLPGKPLIAFLAFSVVLRTASFEA